ncbi:hypothetical protein CEP52_000116 [Fusarium oligoseptatum]|uniref:Uncharacterized protein n=1 Tax=Fusarium oligoseptatum TaxID=2604345 RepID=A0A428UPT2_9HYPO|nr:hypothetical protein CEP52_000116 [Fusarium oligoseptatum]
MASLDRTKSRPKRAESAEISPLTKALLVYHLHEEAVNGKAVFGVDRSAPRGTSSTNFAVFSLTPCH